MNRKCLNYTVDPFQPHALACLDQAIEATSNDGTFFQDRVKLFEQAGLQKVAELEQTRLNANEP